MDEDLTMRERRRRWRMVKKARRDREKGKWVRMTTKKVIDCRMAMGGREERMETSGEKESMKKKNRREENREVKGRRGKGEREWERRGKEEKES